MGLRAACEGVKVLESYPPVCIYKVSTLVPALASLLLCCFIHELTQGPRYDSIKGTTSVSDRLCFESRHFPWHSTNSKWMCNDHE